MPKYLFRCKECGQSATVEADTGSEAEVPICCGVEMNRVWGISYQLKGEGWSWRPNDEIPTEDAPPRKR
jgi:predicted nucleic acid-binding Zn ribbon protein